MSNSMTAPHLHQVSAKPPCVWRSKLQLRTRDKREETGESQHEDRGKRFLHAVGSGGSAVRVAPDRGRAFRPRVVMVRAIAVDFNWRASTAAPRSLVPLSGFLEPGDSRQAPRGRASASESVEANYELNDRKN